MESLYRKYRPLTFESVVGQQHIVSTLKHAVSEGRLSHAYLFCGPRGTGKTTMARILAKSLLCEHAEAARAQGASGCMPDGSCPECEAIAEGTHPDVYELDAASRTGVDNVREEIISSVSFAPVRGAYKVYIIDEVHMLTAAAFNALLKTLEEPPAHVVFILCTTDPQKILETILSRCQRFDFHRIGNEDIVRRLREVCDAEGFEADGEALEIVARHARGGMRDALSTLEQLSVFGAGTVHVSDARSLLGETSSSVLAEFSRGIAARKVADLFAMIRSQAEEGGDLLEFCRDAVAHVRDVYTACVAGANPDLFDCTPDEVGELVEEAGLFGGTDRLARVLTVLDDAAIEMRNASDPRLVLEIAVTRLARPESDLTLEALAERLDKIEAQLAAGVPSAPLDAAGVAALTGTVAPTARGAAGRGAHGEPVARGASGRVPAASSNGSTHTATVPERADVPWSRGARKGGDAAEVAPSVPAAPVAPTVAAAPPAAASEPAASAVPMTSAAPSTSASTTLAYSPAPARPAAPGMDKPAAAVSTPSSQALRQDAAPVAPLSAQGAGAAPAPAGNSTPAVTDGGELQRKWASVVKRVTAAQASRGALLQSARATSDDGSVLTIGFPKGSNFAIKMLGRPDSQAIVLPIICEVFGTRSVEYVMEGAGAAPAASGASSPAVAASSPVGQAAPTAQPVPAAAPPAANPAAPASTPAPAPAVQSSEPSAPSPASVAPKPAPSDVSGAQSASSPDAPRQSPATPLPAPVSPVPATPAQPQAADHTSGPTVLADRDIEADRKAWEDEQVPYDDATIASYCAEDEEVPPFDAPAPAPVAAAPDAASAPESAAATASPVSPVPPVSEPRHAQAVPEPGAKSGALGSPVSSTNAPLGAAPWENSTFASSDEQTKIPQSEEEAKEMLSSIFGAGVKIVNDSQG